MSIASEVKRIQVAKADIKTAIENKGVVVGDGNIDTYAEKIGEISVGSGGDDRYDEGYEAGKQDEYDKFWDTFQNFGIRGECAYMFAYAWNDDIFYPKYSIKLSSCNGMFHSTKITRLKSKLDELGITFDLSNCKTLLQMFQSSSVKDIPIIDGRNATSLSYTFGSGAQVETIEKLILSDKLTNVGNAFQNAIYLTHVIFEGVLEITGLDLHWSTLLDAESYHSLMNILSSNTTGMSVTLPAYEIVKATYDAKYGDGAWALKVVEKSNWTIAYN